MRIATLLSALLFLPLLGHAAQVDPATARTIGEHFIQRYAPTSGDARADQLDLALRMTSVGIASSDAAGSPTFYYVFNRHSGPGFVIVAGDDAVTPILGYSDHNSYDPANLPENMAKWMEGYKQAIAAIVAANVNAPDDIRARWTVLAEAASTVDHSGDRTVNPLLQTQWNQSPYYNAQCPGGSVTGCVATATAQVMKFWNYPTTGTDFHSYNSASYGTLSFNYASTTFNWASMPNSINSANAAIATLMYAVGVGVDMDYSPQESSAYVISSGSPVQNCAEYALKTYFGYDPSMQGLARTSYTDQQWTTMLKAEFDAGRPVVYAGFGTSGGHCFVLDGYNSSNLFHVNWGWAGNSDGYFAIDGLNPPALGTGGGAGGFNSGQQAIMGIHPPAATQTSSIQLYDYVTPAPASIYYGQAFTVTTNIENAATTAFNGDYTAAVFDSQNNFVDYVQTYTAQSLPAGYVYNPPGLVFSNAGDFSLLPGSYTIGIFYRPTGGNWQQVEDANSYTNFAPFTVVNPNDVEMYEAMNVTTGQTLTTGSPVDVQLEAANYGTSDLTVTFDLSLYNLDGTFAQTIQESSSTQVPAGYYVGPLDFTNSQVTVDPGSYLMALQYSSDGGTTWQLVGSSYYGNPIIVTVQQSVIAPDMYEPNNDYASSYVFTPSFSGSQGIVNTVGSNCHVGTDNDYYAVTLPAGYDYSIIARVNDSYNSGDGNTYTLDALWSYTTDGVNWSGTYDDVMPGTISVPGGGTVHFHCAPYFQGQTGTYDLKAVITRSLSSGIEEAGLDGGDFVLMPNPAKDHVDIAFGTGIGPVLSISVINAQGQELRHIEPMTGMERVAIDLVGLAQGVYYVQARTAQGIGTRTLVKGE